MLNIEEKFIDEITKSLNGLSRGYNVKPIELPADFPENEFKQMIDYFNQLIKQNEIIAEFLFALSIGKLEISLPRSASKTISAMKHLQSHLLHLTWQAQQISKGDFSQRVDFMGEFSTAFNTMTSQLQTSFEEIKHKNKELSESEAKLKEAVATKDKFFSIIAHDLRGPIGNFMAMMEFLLENFDTLEGNELLDLLKESGDSAKLTFNLLENLLTWARSQRGAIEYSPVQSDILICIQSNISLLAKLSKDKSISLFTDLSEPLYAYFDEAMITTVIRNLISNSIKFTNAGGTIKVSAEEYDNYLKVIISDTGIGMNENRIQTLFKIDKSISTKGTKGETGTGLGLLLCKEFIETNGGNIHVESELGKGSNFIFTLPKNEL